MNELKDFFEFINEEAPLVKWLFIFCIALLTIAIVSGIVWNNQAISEYNNGICTHCGGHYIFYQAIGHDGGNTYLYRCDGCGDFVEIPILK